jgi:hypothetical protein
VASETFGSLENGLSGKRTEDAEQEAGLPGTRGSFRSRKRCSRRRGRMRCADDAYGTAGIHPHNADRARQEDFQEIERILSQNDRMVAVGEWP